MSEKSGCGCMTALLAVLLMWCMFEAIGALRAFKRIARALERMADATPHSCASHPFANEGGVGRRDVWVCPDPVCDWCGKVLDAAHQPGCELER